MYTKNVLSGHTKAGRMLEMGLSNPLAIALTMLRPPHPYRDFRQKCPPPSINNEHSVIGNI